MKKLLTLLTILMGCLLLQPTSVKASHLMGSDITWKCLGTDTFLITVTVYRDCNGIPLPDQQFTVQSGCSASLTISANAKMSGGKDITPTCKKSCTRCTSSGCSFPYGIQQWFFTGKVIFKTAQEKKCCDWNINWSQCCRNGALTTLSPGNFYVEANMNRCSKPCDNSPYFTNPPVAIVCSKQCITFNLGVNDDDLDASGNADSLVYSFTKPIDSKSGKTSTYVTFNSPYTWDKPLKFSGWPNKNASWNPPKCDGIHLDSASGDVQFMATKADQTVLSILVQEYGKDATGKPFKKGETRRDLQLIIIDCKNNKIPQLSGVDGTNDNEVEICANTTKCFTINSYDPDAKDTVTVKWNSGIAGATFTVEKKKQFPRSTFCWTPGNDKVRSYPYQFVVNAQDDACPVNGRTSRSFRVRVRPSPEVTIKDSIAACGDVYYTATPKKGSQVKDYVWSGDDRLLGYGPKLKHHYRKPGTYKWFLTTINSYGCTSQDSGTISIAPYIWVEVPHDTFVCAGTSDSLTVLAFPHLNDGPTTTYRWVDGTSKQYLKTKIKGDTSLWVEITDNSGCKNWDTMKITTKKPVKPNLGPDIRNCFGISATIGDTTVTEPRIGYKWYNAANPSITLGSSNSMNVKDSGNYVLSTIDSVGCRDYDTIFYATNQPIDAVASTYKGCQNNPVTINGGTGDSLAAWVWTNFDLPPVVLATGKRATFIPTADMSVLVTVTQNYKGTTCTDQDTVQIKINPKPAVFLSTIPGQCLNYPSVDLAPFTNIQGGVWSVSKKSSGTPAVSVTSNKFYPTKAGVGKHTLNYYYKNPTSGCDTNVTTTVDVDPIPKIKLIEDTFVCYEGTALDLGDLNVSPAGGSSGGVWSGPGVSENLISKQYFFNQSDPSVRPNTIVHLLYEYADPFSAGRCSNSDTAHVRVISVRQPTAKDLTMCESEGPRVLAGSPVTPYTKWTYVGTASILPGSISQDASGTWYFNPGISGSGSFPIEMEISSKGLCPKKDTLMVTVKPAPDLKYIGPSQVCVNSGLIDLKMQSSIGGTYTYTGPGVKGKFFDPSNSAVSLSSPNKIIFKLSGANGCPNDTYTTITVFDTASAGINAKAVICAGEDIDVEVAVTNGVFDQWVTNDATATFLDPKSPKTKLRPGANQISTGQWKVSALYKTITGSPCSGSSVTFAGTINPLPVPKFAPERDEDCAPFTVSFADSSKFVALKEYSWGDGTPNTIATGKGTIKHTYDHYGVYHPKVYVKSAAGCAGSFDVSQITVHQMPVVDFTANPTYTTISLPTIQFNDATVIEEPLAKVQAVHFWDFGDGEKILGSGDEPANPIHTYKDTGFYTITHGYTTAFGCNNLLTKKEYINIRPDLLVFIPNAFTPNKLFNDRTKVNEKFNPVVTNEGGFVFQVFNRWGELMFETTDKTAGWDGTFMNEPVEEGVYVYVLKVASLSGKKYKYTGSITLLR